MLTYVGFVPIKNGSKRQIASPWRRRSVPCYVKIRAPKCTYTGKIYMNWTKDHKIELVVFIRESVKVVRRGAAAVPVFFFSHPYFDDGESYSTK